MGTLLNKQFSSISSLRLVNRLFGGIPFVFNKLPHLKRLGVIVFFIVSTLASSIALPIIQAQPSYAATKAASKATDMDWQIQSWWYYNAVVNCMANSSGYNLQDSNIDSGDWFSGNGNAVGYYMRNAVPAVGSDGSADCGENDSQIVKQALKLWGLDGTTVMCEAGVLVREQGQDCEQGHTEFTWKDMGDKSTSTKKLSNYLLKTVYDSTSPPKLSSAELYLLYQQTFLNGCANGDKALTIKPSGSQVFQLTQLQGSGADAQLATVYYIANHPSDWQANYATNPNTQKTCGWLADQINNPDGTLARAYLAAVKSGSSGTASNSPGGQDGDGGGDGKSSCSVDGIGWIVCPVANAMASMTDWAFTVVSAFMRVDPLDLSTTGNPLYSAWANMRNIANIAFVIAFLIIIYSQITGAGITNYGLKKMLPKLIIAAILVNLSYYICAIAVDVSNILGMSIQSVFSGMTDVTAPHAVTDAENTWSSVTSVVLGAAGGAGALVAFTALSSSTIWAALVGLLPLLIAALFALVVAFLVLLARQALIIILIVLAPLAFVAFLLPNTEDWFKRWRKFFTTLLLLFPVMALIFGGSKLASAIIRESSNAPIASSDTGVALTGFFLYIGSLAILAIPFFITPLLMRVSGGVLGKFGGMINNRNKGPFDRAKKWSEQKAKNAQNRGYANSLQRSGRSRFLGYGARRRAKNNAVAGSLEQEAKRTETGFIAETAQGSEAFRQRMAGTNNPEATQRVLANAINVQTQLEADEVKAAVARIDKAVLTRDELRDLGRGNSVTRADGTNFDGSSVTTRMAAMKQMTDRGDFEGMNGTWDHLASAGDDDGTMRLRKSFADTLAASSNRPGWFGQGALQAMRETGTVDAVGNRRGVDDSTQFVEESVKNNVYSANKIVLTDKDELKIVANINNSSTNISLQDKQRLLNNAATAQTDPELARQIGKNRNEIEAIRTNSPVP